MYRIIYILFKLVKFQHNDIVKYNSLYSVHVAISQGLNKFFPRFVIYQFINNNLIGTLLNILTREDSRLDSA